jgi:hypothetical protein
MEAEIIIRGFPSRHRFAEWRQANMLTAEQLPRLTKEQAERARKLRITEKEFAVALKVGELARDQSFKKMECVAKRIHQELQKRDHDLKLAELIWDFDEQKFNYVVTRVDGAGQSLEDIYSIPAEMVEELVLERDGAEQNLVSRVASDLELLVGRGT